MVFKRSINEFKIQEFWYLYNAIFHAESCNVDFENNKSNNNVYSEELPNNCKASFESFGKLIFTMKWKTTGYIRGGQNIILKKSKTIEIFEND